MSTEPAAEQFVQEYQARYGTAPPPYAAEGWDAAQRIIAAVAAGATDRAPLAAALASQKSYSGVAGTYRFGGDGELVSGPVHLFQEEYAGWSDLGSAERVISSR